MKHSMYSNHKKEYAPKGKINAHVNRMNNHKAVDQNPKRKSEMVIDNLMTVCMQKYDQDIDTRREIVDHHSMCRINITIAEKYHDKKAVHRLEKELISYLNSKING